MKFLKTKRQLLCLLCGALCVGTNVFSQDLHFSQFMNSPLLTNPANTGFIPEADYRLGINYRNQWSAIMAVPYKTMSAYGDVQVFRDRIENGWLGLGGVILHDVAGSGNLTSTKIYGSVAYHQMLNAGSLVSAGFNLGWANKQINTGNLKFPDQFDGKFFDNHLPTNVALATNNINYLDIQAGLNYAYFPSDKIYINAGFSAMHVNRPRESFFEQVQGVDNRIPARYTGFLNGSFKMNDQVIINPNIYYSTQAKASELVGGMNVRYNLSGDGENELIGGLYYRYKDAFIPMVGLKYKDYTFTFTYDATTSSLKNYDNTRGAFEFSLVKDGFFSSTTDRQSLCPSFKNGY
jgi:type IX secretion system PorP/SprF family membrane protein